MKTRRSDWVALGVAIVAVISAGVAYGIAAIPDHDGLYRFCLQDPSQGPGFSRVLLVDSDDPAVRNCNEAFPGTAPSAWYSATVTPSGNAPAGGEGVRGPTGPTGLPGLQGSGGLQGPTGKKGPTGPAGDPYRQTPQYKYVDFETPRHSPRVIEWTVNCGKGYRAISGGASIEPSGHSRNFALTSSVPTQDGRHWFVAAIDLHGESESWYLDGIVVCEKVVT